jgi:hypothetical protein
MPKGKKGKKATKARGLYLVCEIADGATYVSGPLPVDEEDRERYSVEAMTPDEALARSSIFEVWNVELTR